MALLSVLLLTTGAFSTPVPVQGPPCEANLALRLYPAEHDQGFLYPNCPADECVDMDENAGTSIATITGRLAMGAPGHDTNRGAVYTYSKDETTNPPGAFPLQQIYGQAAGDEFGASVAISLTWLIVGAPGANSDSGAVYIYAPVFPPPPGTCPFENPQVINAPDPATNPRFGRSVAISKTGDFIVVGAREAAYVYRYDVNAGSWLPDGPIDNKLEPDDPAFTPEFGKSVAIDADWVIVGAPDELAPSPSTDRVGAAYFFRRFVQQDPFSILWLKLDKELNPVPADKDDFGASVDLFAGHAVVGAPLADSPEQDRGAVYAFEVSGNYWSWDNTPYIGSDTNANDQFGTSVAIGRKGHVIIGAPFEERDLGAFTTDGTGWVGRAYQYDVDATGILVEVCTFLPLDLEDDARFGSLVSIDDENGAIGAPRHDRIQVPGATCDPGCSTTCLENTGATFVFEVKKG